MVSTHHKSFIESDCFASPKCVALVSVKFMGPASKNYRVLEVTRTKWHDSDVAGHNAGNICMPQGIYS